jgi:hypothetical protein
MMNDMNSLSKGISDVIQILEKSPLIAEATVFGSLLDRPAKACDVDLAFVIDAPFSTQLLDKYRSLLKAGAYGTPRYGLFDLFLCFQDQTWVRNENCLGFTKAKNAKEIRAVIQEQGQPWSQWRPSVSLHGEVEAATPKTIYFAHPISTYCTPTEERAIRALERAGFVVVNPSDEVHQNSCGNDMVQWAKLAGTCDAIALLPFEDGAIGAGVMKEVDTVHSHGKPVFKIDVDGGAFSPLSQWPQGENILSVEDTRARINPFREARKQAGLTPIPVRVPLAPVARMPRP